MALGKCFQPSLGFMIRVDEKLHGKLCLKIEKGWRICGILLQLLMKNILRENFRRISLILSKKSLGWLTMNFSEKASLKFLYLFFKLFSIMQKMIFYTRKYFFNVFHGKRYWNLLEWTFNLCNTSRIKAKLVRNTSQQIEYIKKVHNGFSWKLIWNSEFRINIQLT